MIESRSGQTRSPASQRSSPVLATTVTEAVVPEPGTLSGDSAVPDAGHSVRRWCNSPRVNREPPTPPASTTMRGGRPARSAPLTARPPSGGAGIGFGLQRREGEQQPPGARVPQHRRVDAVHLADELRGEHGGRWPGRHDPAGGEHDHVVGEGGGQVEVVQRGEGGEPALGEAADEREGVELGADVEVVGRLVEQQQPRLLGQRPGEVDPLALAAGEGAVEPLGELEGADIGEAAQREGAVVAAGRREEAAVGCAAEQHGIRHRDLELAVGMLLCQGHDAGPAAAGRPVESLAVEVHAARCRV